MRFMVMHKMTEALERQVVDPEVMAGVDKLIGEAAGQNVFITGEGLKPTAQRTHLVYKNGRRAATRGPFADAKELIGGFALLRVRDEAEALHWCDRFAAVAGDVELHVGPVVEPWDLGMMPKPEHPPLRVLSLVQATRDDDAPPDAAEAAKMGALIAEMTAAGVLEATGGLASTRRGARIRFEGGKPRIIDGPFAESKELIAGYAILELPSKAAAIDWGVRFGAVVKVEEVDVREMA
ncbi:MAG TPA: YciI family protein [Polyangia bacterium]|nr:YciI family protein [Polyangia bacterium]